MKCLKNTKTGNIVRIDDVQANQMAGNTWKYIAKSEWKSSTRTAPTEQQSVDSEKKEVTVSKKQIRRAKFKSDEK